MVFSSYVFLFAFLPLVLIGYWGALAMERAGGSVRAKTWWLVVASYAFYGWARYDYVVLILFSTVVDFWCARAMAAGEEPRRRRLLLLTSVIMNLGLLGWFKYSGFGLRVTNVGLAWLDAGAIAAPWAEVALPVGISFYTFQSMSYTIDVYRGIVKPVERFSDFLCYVSLFPQLVAGPIVRYRDVAEQLVTRTHSVARTGLGCWYFMAGFAKKTLIANNVGPLAEALFDGGGAVGAVDAWCGTLAYTIQIYFDFSGYSDMAIGLGLMLGFVLPVNFDAPYKAISISDFWRRWHISLSSWLRDYLYIPLGGNRSTALWTYRNLMLTMLLGGLWHGANWTFVAWGAWHGGWLAVERMLGRRALWQMLPGRIRAVPTLLVVMIGWVFFRSPNARRMTDVLSGLVGRDGLGELTLGNPHAPAMSLTALVAGLIIVSVARTTQDTVRRGLSTGRIAITWVLFLLGVGQMMMQGFNPFLYFRF